MLEDCNTNKEGRYVFTNYWNIGKHSKHEEINDKGEKQVKNNQFCYGKKYDD